MRAINLRDGDVQCCAKMINRDQGARFYLFLDNVL